MRRRLCIRRCSQRLLTVTRSTAHGSNKRLTIILQAARSCDRTRRVRQGQEKFMHRADQRRPRVADTFDEQYRVDPITGCHVWLRARKGKEARSGGGYGCLKVRGRTIGAHRFAYERAHGRVPAGLHVTHLCHNTLCVNPAHLRAETNDENQAAKAAVGRAPSRLTTTDVVAIRSKIAAGALQREVAAEYGIQQVDVSNIVHRKYWRHVG